MCTWCLQGESSGGRGGLCSSQNISTAVSGLQPITVAICLQESCCLQRWVGVCLSGGLSHAVPRVSAPRDTTPTHSNLIDCPLLCHSDQVTMTEKTQEPHVEDDDDELDGKLNYKPPPQKTLQELQELDKDDESLAKYKKSLLGDGPVVVGMLGHTDREGLGRCTATVCCGDETRCLQRRGILFDQGRALLVLEDWGLSRWKVAHKGSTADALSVRS